MSKPYEESFEIADRITRRLVQHGHFVDRPEDTSPCTGRIAEILRDEFDFDFEDVPPEPEVILEPAPEAELPGGLVNDIMNHPEGLV